MRVRMKKILSAALCAVTLLGALCLPAFASGDPYYSGSVDPSTGAPVMMKPSYFLWRTSAKVP